MTHTLDVNLDHMAEILFVSFFLCPTLNTVLFGRESHHWQWVHNYWELCIGDLSLLPHLFMYPIIYWYHYGLMDIYFVLWVIIQYNLFCFSNSSSFDHWALFWLDFHVLLTYLIIFFRTPLFCSTTRCSKLILYTYIYIYISQFYNQPFL